MKVSEFVDFFPPNSVVIPNRSRVLSNKIVSIVDSSQKVTKGSVFFAVKGNSADGHQFIKDAVARGAALIVVEDSAYLKELSVVPHILVSDTRFYFEKMCGLFFGRKDERIFNIGITGTNGKTSTTYIIEYLLQNHGIPTGVIGTINHRIGKKIWPTTHTTPDPWTVHKRYADFKKNGALASAVEVTSHGIDQKRLHSINFDIGIFTNLTQDHLDYHGTMENYFAVKEKLFLDILGRSNKSERFALVNGDDIYGQRLKMAFGITRHFFGKDKSFPIWFEIKAKHLEYQKIEIGYFGKRYTIRFPLLGVHNVYNFLPCLFVCSVLKIPIESVIKKIESFSGIPGRLQRVNEIKKKNVYVDFAHTPDGVAKTLETIWDLRAEVKAKNKIVTVLGCGGDRDGSKRPIMGGLAEAKSDLVIVTSDNPRTENPLAIIDQIKAGFKSQNNKFFEENRSKAIKKAMDASKEGDIILILGKGHETYQIIGDKKFPFDDYLEVLKYGK